MNEKSQTKDVYITKAISFADLQFHLAFKKQIIYK